MGQTPKSNVLFVKNGMLPMKMTYIKWRLVICETSAKAAESGVGPGGHQGIYWVIDTRWHESTSKGQGKPTFLGLNGI
jgi:hypothetical protein